MAWPSPLKPGWPSGPHTVPAPWQERLPVCPVGSSPAPQTLARPPALVPCALPPRLTPCPPQGPRSRLGAQHSPAAEAADPSPAYWTHRLCAGHCSGPGRWQGEVDTGLPPGASVSISIQAAGGQYSG